MSRHSPGIPLEASSAIIGGMPVFGGGGGIPLTFGTVYFVDPDNGNDSNDGKSMDTAFATISKAYSSVTTNKHDVIALSGNSAHAQTNTSGTAPLKITKNRVHFVGLGGGSRYYGQRTRITMGVTTGTTTCILENTGVGNTFTNIKFDSGDTLSTSKYAVVEAGEYAQYTCCEFYQSQQKAAATSGPLCCNGDSAYFLKCMVGSLATQTSVAKANVVLTKGIVSGMVSRDVVFEDCMFFANTTSNTFGHIRATGATDVERTMIFKNCIFQHAVLGSATVALVFTFSAAQTQGQVLVMGGGQVNHTALAKTSDGVYFLGAPIATAATAGDAVAVTN